MPKKRVFVAPLGEPAAIIQVGESWLKVKILEIAAMLDAMDPQEREAFVERMALGVSTVATWPLIKRYYRKRGAPEWLAPALQALLYRLAEIEMLARRAERQAIRDRKMQKIEITNARGGP